MRGFQSYSGGDIAGDIRAKYGFDGDLLDIFAGNTGPVVHKWHHYIPLYDRYFARFRHRPTRFLEIGVSRGGSLQMWRRYLGPEATIFGIDVDPACAAHDGEAAQVRIGSQADPRFLSAVVEEMGGVDVVLDDGSHQMDHVRESLRTLFPLLSLGGVYMIEDLHAAYFDKFGGGLHEPRSVFNDVRRLIDDVHRWYHEGPPSFPGIADTLSGIHVHDSILVLDKDRTYQPVASKVGGESG